MSMLQVRCLEKDRWSLQTPGAAPAQPGKLQPKENTGGRKVTTVPIESIFVIVLFSTGRTQIDFGSRETAREKVKNWFHDFEIREISPEVPCPFRPAVRHFEARLGPFETQVQLPLPEKPGEVVLISAPDRHAIILNVGRACPSLTFVHGSE